MLDVQAVCYIVPDMAVENKAIVVTKSDGDGLEPTVTVKSAEADQPWKVHRRLFMSALGRRLLKIG